jgi:N-acetylglucosaminyldiphosphoundecaprenol N-acetyl-beta-D-mannosaminyltransferase
LKKATFELSRDRKSLLGLPLDIHASAKGVLEQLGTESVLLGYLNPFAWSIARTKSSFPAELEAMDLVVCDGIAIQNAARRILGIEPTIISLDYSGIAGEYLRLFRDRGARVCLVGARPEIMEAAQAVLEKDFPGLNVVAAFPGYGAGPEQARDFVLESGADYVLAGLGMGLQEQFLLDLRQQGWQGSGICVGAFFDRLGKPEHDYPAWSVRLNLRFLGNITRRPGYYLRRYCVEYLPFLKQYVRALLRRDRTGV